MKKATTNQNVENRPYYHKIYADMIKDKYPDKVNMCESYLKKENWTALDVITVNDILFGSNKEKEDIAIDQKHRAYDTESIKQILIYQRDNRLNNIQVANQYNLSRNTVAKWKQLFPECTDQSKIRKKK